MFDCFLGDGYIYWADSASRTISRIKRDLTERQTLVNDGPSGYMGWVEGLAVDWIAGKSFLPYFCCLKSKQEL